MKDYYKFYKNYCKNEKKINTKDIQEFCNFKHKINDNWTKPFCNLLTEKINDLTLKYKKLNRAELLELVSKINKNVKKNSSKEYLISLLLFSLKNCHNQMTIYGDKIQQIHPEKLYITSQGFCHNIDELVEYMISTNGERNIDPNDPSNTLKIWQNNYEKNKIINHKFLDSSIKNHYLQTIQKNKKTLTIDKTDFQYLMNLIAYLAFICLNDHPSSFVGCDFKTATEALGYFSEIIAELPKEHQQFILNLKNGSGSSIKDLLEDPAMCIHMKGDYILNIYLYNYKLFESQKINLVKFITKINENLYGTVRLYENELKKIYPTTPIRYILSFYNEDKNQFVQIDRNYLGNTYIYPILKPNLDKTTFDSILEALKFFKIL